MPGGTPVQHEQGRGFHHQALLYGDEDEFLDALVPFVREGCAAGEPVLVVLGDRGTALLRGALDGQADEVRFTDMDELGRNPARIIPLWRRFVDDHAGRPTRGVGEPIAPDRGQAELAECQRHEALLNLAFADAPPFSLVCPYDTNGLSDDVLEEARRSHPHIVKGGVERLSESYDGAAVAHAFEGSLPAPTAEPVGMAVTGDRLREVRRFVSAAVERAGISGMRAAEAVLAANEIATNSIRHAGGKGALSVWQENGSLVFEVRDPGHITDPLVGRRKPSPEQLAGRGLWIANQLCDLVQIRSSPTGTVVRLHISVN